jgi:hypothetical protein
MSQQFNTAIETARSKEARERLDYRFRLGEGEQSRLVKQVANMHIRDKLMYPQAMVFACEQGERDGVRVHYASLAQLREKLGRMPTELEVAEDAIEREGYLIHPHALGQVSAVAGIPRLYVRRLRKGTPWERVLLEHNLNELMHKGNFLDRRKQKAKYLQRIVGEGKSAELRGFLTRSFNRHLASLPLLRGFMVGCNDVGARPIEATTSAVRFSLKCFLPHVFEPVDGEFVTFGATWSNSDFGSGRMKVAMSALRVNSGTMSVLEDSLSRVHIGSIIEENDLQLSDEAMAKEVDAQVTMIMEVVKKQLSPEPVNRLCEAIRIAHETEVPWHRIKGELGKILQKKELENIEEMLKKGSDDIEDLPPVGVGTNGDPIATRWWASNVVGWIADREQNPDRKSDLQTLAGTVLKAS